MARVTRHSASLVPFRVVPARPTQWTRAYAVTKAYQLSSDGPRSPYVPCPAGRRLARSARASSAPNSPATAATPLPCPAGTACRTARPRHRPTVTEAPEPTTAPCSAWTMFPPLSTGEGRTANHPPIPTHTPPRPEARETAVARQDLRAPTTSTARLPAPPSALLERHRAVLRPHGPQQHMECSPGWLPSGGTLKRRTETVQMRAAAGCGLYLGRASRRSVKYGADLRRLFSGAVCTGSNPAEGTPKQGSDQRKRRSEPFLHLPKDTRPSDRCSLPPGAADAGTARPPIVGYFRRSGGH
jgi:hypothetical protein